MILTDDQVTYIDTNLEFYGVLPGDLKDDLLDHICTYIEQSSLTTFEEAYNEAILKFGGHLAMGSLQRETIIMVMLKKNTMRQRTAYVSGFIAAFLISTGATFKMMHWPMANVLMMFGFIILNFVFMPVYFFHKYKTADRPLI